jgi:hypothetical protein
MIDFRFRLSSLTDVLLCCVVLIAIYSIYSLVLFWIRPYQSPLASLCGPPTKHWYFGFLNPAEAKSLQMAQFLSKGGEGCTLHTLTPMLIIVSSKLKHMVMLIL